MATDTSEGAHSFLHHPTTSSSPITTDVLVDVYLGDKGEIEYYVEEMRRRHLAIVLMQGEDFLLLPRMTSGNRCPYWKSEEQQCAKPLDSKAPCYNTGWIKGYHDPITIKIVIPQANKTAVSYSEGVRKEWTPRPWTIHTPVLNARDILIQKTTGMRSEVRGVTPVLFRGLPMHQEFEMYSLTPDKDSYVWSIPVPVP